jgi:hypothetical protein
MRDPAVGVGIRDRVRVAHAHEDPPRVDILAQDLAQHLGPERPVELVRLAAASRHRHVEEPLLLVGRQRLAQPPHQLAGAHDHARMRTPLLFLLGDHHHVQPLVRIARGHQRADRARDVGLVVGGDEVQEHRRGRLALEALLAGQLAQARVGLADEASGDEHATPVESQLEGSADVEEEGDEEEERDEVHAG